MKVRILYLNQVNFLIDYPRTSKVYMQLSHNEFIIKHHFELKTLIYLIDCLLPSEHSFFSLAIGNMALKQHTIAGLQSFIVYMYSGSWSSHQTCNHFFSKLSMSLFELGSNLFSFSIRLGVQHQQVFILIWIPLFFFPCDNLSDFILFELEDFILSMKVL